VIIDLHNHVWPDAVARRALSAGVPGMTLAGDGTVDGLSAAQDAAGVDRSVCLAVANGPDAVPKANAFIGGLDRSRFVPFGTVHPELPVADNLAALRSAGVQGVKIHPVFQRLRLDDPELIPLLDALAGEFPVLVHVGAGAGSTGEGATPAMVREWLRAVPGLDIIACHFGGYHDWEDAAAVLHGLPLYLDTSWPPSLATLDRGTVREAIRRHGVERVLFASDWPTASPAKEIEAIRELGLTDDETELVLGGNAQRLLRV
jgi:predicted TIM-barrel fold metal-dependent hydrolase